MRKKFSKERFYRKLKNQNKTHYTLGLTHFISGVKRVKVDLTELNPNPKKLAFRFYPTAEAVHFLENNKEFSVLHEMHSMSIEFRIVNIERKVTYGNLIEFEFFADLKEPPITTIDPR